MCFCILVFLFARFQFKIRYSVEQAKIHIFSLPFSFVGLFLLFSLSFSPSKPLLSLEKNNGLSADRQNSRRKAGGGMRTSLKWEECWGFQPAQYKLVTLIYFQCSKLFSKFTKEALDLREASPPKYGQKRPPNMRSGYEFRWSTWESLKHPRRTDDPPKSTGTSRPVEGRPKGWTDGWWRWRSRKDAAQEMGSTMTAIGHCTQNLRETAVGYCFFIIYMSSKLFNGI